MLTFAVLLLLARQDRVSTLEASAKRHPTATIYRALADAYLADEQFEKASSAFGEASRRYAKLGDPNAAKVLDERAKRYATTIRMFVEQPTSTDYAARYFTRAKFEPVYGCYLGMNIEREEGSHDPQAFNNIVQKHHAIFFIYRSYGMPFPTQFARQLRLARAGIQIAFEPKSLDQVQDDDYLRRFASDAAKSGIPVFLRFASEMNGDWTFGSYGGNPALYRQKFRLVAQVVREVAPNVAMVWCPNEIPEEPIASYYPGADAVDWVGVNFYSVLYNDGDRAKEASWRDPTTALDYVYKTYAAKHPIMVGEWAATHRSVIDDRDRPDFAIEKIRKFYAEVPRLYPRVKAVNWLSMNTMRYADGPHKLNDFSLLSDDVVAKAYSEAVSTSLLSRRDPSERRHSI